MKWLGAAAMAMVIAGSCTQKNDKELIRDTPAAAQPTATTPITPPSVEGLPAGDYKLDPLHSTLAVNTSVECRGSSL